MLSGAASASISLFALTAAALVAVPFSSAQSDAVAPAIRRPSSEMLPAIESNQAHSSRKMTAHRMTALVAALPGTFSVTAYSVDGTNAGTARLGRNVTLAASMPGQPNAAFTWSLSGAGTITSAGIYSAPAAMPAASRVTVTATLSSNAAVTATYPLQLIYSAPKILWVTPSALYSGVTSTVSISGNDFTAATTVSVNGVAVPSVFQAPNAVVAQIPVAAGPASALSIVASNPLPGGGNSPAVSAATKPPTMSLNAYSADGANSQTVRLGRNVTLSASVVGMSGPTLNWSVQGAGTITPAGVYTAPVAMPSNNAVTITAAVASNPSVTASYALHLIYTAPKVRWVVPSALVSGATNAIQISGDDFTAATTITVNGAAVPSTFQAPNGVLAQIPIAAGSTTSVSVAAQNPSPGGGISPAVTAPIKPVTIAVSSYSKTVANPTSASLGQSVQFSAVVSGGNPAITWPVTWSLQGAGTLSSTGLYMAPAAMPSNSTVIVTSALASNAAISATSSLSLINSSPVVNQSEPVQATAGTTIAITFFGQNFSTGTTIDVNGQPVATTYLSPTSLSALIAVADGATGSLSVTAVNPANGGQSGVFSLSIGDSSLVQATIGTSPGRTIPGDFVGFSHEWGESATYMGTAQSGVNNIYLQLVKNLTNPGTPFFVRIGGGSTDNTVEPTASTVTAYSDLATAMPVRFSLGVNLAANNLQLAEDQASFFSAHMPAGALSEIEFGNEPDNYFQSGVRSSSFSFSDYLSDFAKWDAGIAPLLPSGVKVLGPSLTTVWHLQQNLPALEQAEASNISVISAHFYAGYENGPNTVFPDDYLLQESTVKRSVPSYQIIASQAHHAGQFFRIGEMNSIDGSGKLGWSNTFGAALWAADVMFEDVNAGVDGVNWHGMSGCAYCAFTFGMQSANGKNSFRLQQVNPLYYGMLFFHEATANSAKLLPVTVTSKNNVKVWATVDESGTVHVAILNKDLTFAGDVSVTLPGYGPATASRMVAPNYKSVAGIAIGGQTLDNSFDGNLIGSPMTESFTPTNSVYTIPVQPTSAVLLTLTK